MNENEGGVPGAGDPSPAEPSTAEPDPGAETTSAAPVPADAGSIDANGGRPAEPDLVPAAMAAPTLTHDRVQWELIDAATEAETRRRIDVRGAFTRILDIYLRRPMTFIWLGLPVGALAAASNTLFNPRQPGSLLLLGLFAIVVSQVVDLALIVAADDIRGGRPGGPLDALRRARGSVAASLGSSVLRGIILFGVLIVWAIVIGIVLYSKGGSQTRIDPSSVAAWFVPLAVVMFYIWIRWSLTSATIVLEGTNAFASLGRSRGLTKGNVWRIGALYLMVGLVVLPMSIGSGFAGLVIGIPAVTVILSVVASGIGLPLLAITAATIHADLTARQAEPSPAPVRPAIRRLFAGGVFVAGGILLVGGLPSYTASVAQRTLDAVSAESRGHIIAGSTRNLGDPCTPSGEKTSFVSGEAIWLGGYFTKLVPAGQSARIVINVNGRQAVDTPLASPDGSLGCYYEPVPVSNLPAGGYEIIVMLGSETIATGAFEVR